MPAKSKEKPASPAPPAPEKAPASKVAIKDAAKEKLDQIMEEGKQAGYTPEQMEAYIQNRLSKMPKPAAKPVGLAKPAAQPPAMLAKDLGAEKFLAKCLIALKETASQEEITKAVNTEWARIAAFKLQSALAIIKAKFAPSGFNPAGSLILGAGDAVDKDKNVLGATVYLLKDKRFTNLKLLNDSIMKHEFLYPGRMVSKMNAPKFTIDPATVESVPAHDTVVYNALLEAAIPKDQLITHEFKQYEIVAIEGKVRGFGEEFTNPLPTKNGDLKFTISPLAATEWDIAAWVHARQFGDAYLAMLGEAELNEYRKMDTDGNAAFLDAMLRDQIVMVCGKVGKDVFKEYKEYKSLELDVITLMLRPDELDPVVYESRPVRAAKPASSSVDNLISGQSIGEQPADQPPQLPPDVIAKIAEITALTGKEESTIQQDVVDIMAANAEGNMNVTMVEALDAMLVEIKEKAAKPPAGSLAPPTKEVDYTNPEDDTPALKRIRATAIKSKTWEFSYKDILDYAKQWNIKEITEQSVSKDVFEAFIAANKGGK